MTFEQMIERVRLYVQNRPSLESMIGDLINEAAISLAMPFEFRKLQQIDEIDYAADSVNITLMTAPLAIVRVRDLTNKTLLLPQDEEWYDQQDTTLPSALPRYYIHTGDTLALYPMPYQDTTLRVRSKRFPVRMVDDTDEPDGFPLDWHPIICKLAAAEAHFLLGEDQKGQARLNSALADISARQEERTIEARSSQGRMIIDRSRYFRGYGGSRTQWR